MEIGIGERNLVGGHGPGRFNSGALQFRVAIVTRIDLGHSFWLAWVSGELDGNNSRIPKVDAMMRFEVFHCFLQLALYVWATGSHET